MSGPGPNKVPFNFYISRAHLAVVVAEAREQKTTKTAILTELLDRLVARRYQRGAPIPRPTPKYNAPWFAKKKAKVTKSK
jgi:hypothetical protein